jgi:hypothetical protein
MPGNDAVKLHETTDAHVWAEEFCRVFGERVPALKGKRDWVQGWFANAIMAGYDAGRRDAEKELDRLRDEADRLRDVGRDR